mmetsp:Transcript_3506/g.10886  ORF Transcript_3506/g.10886 Transcript_3506/m.10886 type:complete len:110 (+) Transcript_3506:150-479(+)
MLHVVDCFFVVDALFVIDVPLRLDASAPPRPGVESGSLLTSSSFGFISSKLAWSLGPLLRTSVELVIAPVDATLEGLCALALWHATVAEEELMEALVSDASSKALIVPT